MSRGLFWATTCLTLLCGSVLFLYVLFNVPPVDGAGAMDMAAVGLLFAGLAAGAMGIGSATARILHRQWPALAGAPGVSPNPLAALRQGALFAIGVVVLAGLAITRQLDVAFIVVTLVMVGLVEAFVQSRA